MADTVDTSLTYQIRDPSPGVYRGLRWLLRMWFTLFFNQIRLLKVEVMPDSCPALFVVNHPASLLDALILIAAFEQPIRCLLDRSQIRGRLGQWLASTLGIIPFERNSDGWKAALDPCAAPLADRAAVMTFAYPQERPSKGAGAGPPPFATFAAALAMEAESRHGGQLGLPILPVHLFLPVAPSGSKEVLMSIDTPLFAVEYHALGGAPENRTRALALALEEACRQNAFRLQPGELRSFMADLESIFRGRLDQEWSQAPNWKQSVEGFRLSRFLERTLEELNVIHPGRIVALREALEAWREARRRRALEELEAETTGDWVKSGLRRAGAWIETLVEAPIALYGMLNHLLVMALLSLTGFLRPRAGQAEGLIWTARAAIVLSCYAFQIGICGHFLGRAGAGYYAVTLPFSGALLVRFIWLLRHRTRLIFFVTRAPGQAARLARKQKAFLDQLNEARDDYAALIGLPRASF